MERPEKYRWNSLGYHIQTGKKDDFLTLDFGLIEFGPGEIRSAGTSELHPSTIVPTYGAGRAGLIVAPEQLKRYRRYVYEAGTVNRPEKGKTNPSKSPYFKNLRLTQISM